LVLKQKVLVLIWLLKLLKSHLSQFDLMTLKIDNGHHNNKNISTKLKGDSIARYI